MLGTMYRAKKPLITDLNTHLICPICKGYFIDATTITECLHTFCRSCIVKYLRNSKYCPVCDVQVHKSKPLLSLRSDKIVQDLVYKLVPKLYSRELSRRKEYYQNNTDAKPTVFEQSTEELYNYILSPEETLYVTLSYYGSSGKPRYLRCPSALSIMHLQKLINAKFDLLNSHHVDILYNNECLNPSFSLMDVMYIYKLSKHEPLLLTYKIFEYVSKRIKLDDETCKENKLENSENANNNNNWKEVQLRISENGEMSVTGIQDTASKSYMGDEIVALLDTKPITPPKKKEIPDLKIIAKSPSGKVQMLSNCLITSGTKKPEVPVNKQNNSLKSDTSKKSTTVATSVTSSSPTVISSELSTAVTLTISSVQSKTTTSNAIAPKNSTSTPSTISLPPKSGNLPVLNSDLLGINSSINAASTTMVFSTINSTKCSTTTDNTKSTEKPKAEKIEEKGTKRKNESTSNDQAKKTVNSEVKNDTHVTESNNIDHCKLLNINKHDLTIIEIKKSVPKEVEKPKIEELSITRIKPEIKPKENSQKSAGIKIHSSITLNNTGVNEFSIVGRHQLPTQPCYMPKSYSPVLTVPKPPINKNLNADVKSSKTQLSGSKCNDVGAGTSTNSVQNSLNNKMVPKTKANVPLSYKTLRDPPKSWNSQISKLSKQNIMSDNKADQKNAKPAKFFKMRNNMPRFLGNPASGVKPMYALHVSPEKEKPIDKVVENREIKKHSIIKIDPKTLKPISEKAPEISSLSSSSSSMASPSVTTDLKINTSQVSIFNPLKMQSSPKTNEPSRKSPKSPHSPVPKNRASPPVKRDKLNFNFTPPNPFVPNLSSQTVSPNQFLCPTVPPGFPTYDPHVMAAYHSLFYGPRMGFHATPTITHLGLDFFNQQRKNFAAQNTSTTSPDQISKPVSTQNTNRHPNTILNSPVGYVPRTSPLPSPKSQSIQQQKKSTKENQRSEKSLLNTLEKLTQNRAKESLKQEISSSSDTTNSCEAKKSDSSDTVVNNDKKAEEIQKLENSSVTNKNETSQDNSTNSLNNDLKPDPSPSKNDCADKSQPVENCTETSNASDQKATETAEVQKTNEQCRNEERNLILNGVENCAEAKENVNKSDDKQDQRTSSSDTKEKNEKNQSACEEATKETCDTKGDGK